MKAVTIRMPAEQHGLLRAIAYVEGISMNTLLIEAVDQVLARPVAREYRTPYEAELARLLADEPLGE